MLCTLFVRCTACVLYTKCTMQMRNGEVLSVYTCLHRVTVTLFSACACIHWLYKYIQIWNDFSCTYKGINKWRFFPKGWLTTCKETRFLTPVANRAMVQAVILRPLKAQARVRARISQFGICGGQRGTGTGFFELVGIPLSVSFHR
jgi:hypothetical protein